MRPCHPIVTLMLGLTVLLSAGGARLRAETAANLFDPTTLHEIRLRLNSRDLAQLRERYTENTFYPASLQWRDVRVWNVAVRARGAGTRNPAKPSLLLDFTRYASRQRFLGLPALVLNNGWLDPTNFRDRLAMSFFTRMGQPAPRESSARVYINDVYHGVYSVVENVDTQFLARAFNDVVGRENPGGFLFEYRNLFPYYASDLGDGLAPYKSVFEARTRTREADSTLYGPLRDLIHEVNGPYDAVWRSRVERYIDLRQLVTYVAIENFLSEWDGFTGQWGMNNFYLYRPANSLQHRIIPWDADRTFTSLDESIFERADQNVLFQRAVAFSDLRALYLDVMEQSARSAAQDGWLAAQATFAAAQLRDAIYQNFLKPWLNDTVDQDMASVIDFAQHRSDRVLAEVAAARAARAR